MNYCFFISLIFVLFLYSTPLISKGFKYNINIFNNLNIPLKNNFDTTVEHILGGRNDNKVLILPEETINNWINSNKGVDVILSGFIKINNSINFNKKFNNSITIGGKSDLGISSSMLNGNNKTIDGLENLVFNSWRKILLKNITINDLSNLIFNSKYGNEYLENIRFINNNDINVNIIGRSIDFKDVNFYMLDNTKLKLNINADNYDLVINGDNIIIDGKENAKAYINFGSNDKHHNITLNGVESKISAELDIINTNLQIDKEITLSGKNNSVGIFNSVIKGNINILNSNKLNLVDSILQGNIVFNEIANNINIANSTLQSCLIRFNGKVNNLILNNISSDENSELIFNSNNNIINIYNIFSGKLNVQGSQNKLYFKNAILDKSTMYIKGKDSDLYFSNTTFGGKVFINTIEANTLYFNNVNNKGELTFGNDTTQIVFYTNSNNYLGGKLSIENRGVVNMLLENDVTVNFDYTSSANTAINNMKVGKNVKLILNEHPININNLELTGDTELQIKLKDNSEPYIYAKNAVLDKCQITISTIDSNLELTKKNDRTDIVILKSDNWSTKLGPIILSNALFDYEVHQNFSDKEIILTIKKDKNFLDIIEENYKPQSSLFNKDNLINLTSYLDLLWESKEQTELLDIVSKESVDYEKFNLLLNTMFPVSNNILYKSSFDSITSFINAINGMDNNYGLKNKVWSSLYYLNSNLPLGNKALDLPLKGQGISVGINHRLTEFWDAGISTSLSMSKIERYNYNVSLFNYNLGVYSKYNLSKKLYNTTSLVFSINDFDISREVNYFNLKNVNRSSPKSFGYIINSESNYSIPIFKYGQYNYSVLPRFNLTFGNISLDNYKESGQEPLSIKGGNIFTTTLESGISSLFKIDLKKSNLSTKIGINIGYEYNNLNSTEFKFRDSKMTNMSKLSDFYNSNVYIKTLVDISYTHIKQLYGVNLSLSYTSSKLFDNTNINLSFFVKV